MLKIISLFLVFDVYYFVWRNLSYCFQKTFVVDIMQIEESKIFTAFVICISCMQCRSILAAENQ